MEELQIVRVRTHTDHTSTIARMLQQGRSYRLGVCEIVLELEHTYHSMLMAPSRASLIFQDISLHSTMHLIVVKNTRQVHTVQASKAEVREFVA